MNCGTSSIVVWTTMIIRLDLISTNVENSSQPHLSKKNGTRKHGNKGTWRTREHGSDHLPPEICSKIIAHLLEEIYSVSLVHSITRAAERGNGLRGGSCHPNQAKFIEFKPRSGKFFPIKQQYSGNTNTAILSPFNVSIFLCSRREWGCKSPRTSRSRGAQNIVK